MVTRISATAVLIAGIAGLLIATPGCGRDRRERVVHTRQTHVVHVEERRGGHAPVRREQPHHHQVGRPVEGRAPAYQPTRVEERSRDETMRRQSSQDQRSRQEATVRSNPQGRVSRSEDVRVQQRSQSEGRQRTTVNGVQRSTSSQEGRGAEGRSGGDRTRRERTAEDDRDDDSGVRRAERGGDNEGR